MLCLSEGTGPLANCWLKVEARAHAASSSQYCAQVFLEDAGFDWKILGPDVAEPDYVAWQCDQDAYACSGQKCSAQSILFVHENWAAAGAAPRLSGLLIGRQEVDSRQEAARPGRVRVQRPEAKRAVHPVCAQELGGRGCGAQPVRSTDE